MVIDFLTVKQRASVVSVSFDDDAVADFFDEQVDAGRQPAQFARCWIHTHPGDSAEPSLTDERTFARVFGGSDWAVMFILARTGAVYARLRFNVGPKGVMSLPVAIDYGAPFSGSDGENWLLEYQANIHAEVVDLRQSQERCAVAVEATDLEPFGADWDDEELIADQGQVTVISDVDDDLMW